MHTRPMRPPSKFPTVVVPPMAPQTVEFVTAPDATIVCATPSRRAVYAAVLLVPDPS